MRRQLRQPKLVFAQVPGSLRWAFTSRVVPAQSDLKAQVEALVEATGGVEQAALRLQAQPGTLHRILAGKPLAPQTLRRIAGELASAQLAKASPLEQELKHLHKLYLQLGTLEAVGRKVGLTRECVRQKLERGSRLGLFSYTRLPVRHRPQPFFTRDQLVAELMSLGSSKGVAIKWQTHRRYLAKVFAAYGITPTMRREWAIHARKQACHRDYRRLRKTLGHDLSTTELQASVSCNLLYNRIHLLWGRWKAFKADHLGWRPQPPLRKKRNRLHLREEVAFQKRMGELDIVRECLQSSHAESAAKIASLSGIPVARASRLLRLLVAVGEVVHEEPAINPRYALPPSAANPRIAPQFLLGNI